VTSLPEEQPVDEKYNEMQQVTFYCQCQHFHFPSAI